MNKHAPISSLPKKLPLLALLGITSPPGLDWDRVCALQHQGVAGHSRLRMIASILAGLCVAALFYGRVEIWALLGWVAALGGVLFNTTRYYDGLAVLDRKSLPRDEVARVTVGSLILAVMWIVPIFFFVPHAALDQQLVLWILMATMMTGSAVTFSAVPAGPILFQTIVGGASAAMFFAMGHYEMALAVVACCAMLSFATIKSAERYLRLKATEAGLEEKEELVSLLLREFEEGGADWLWQLDAGRCIVRASPRFAYALGRDAADLNGRPLVELISGDGWSSGQVAEEILAFTQKLKNRESFSNLIVPVQVNDRKCWWELSASPRFDEAGIFVGFNGVGSDVTEQQESAHKIRHMASFDPLTGLPNRTQLTECMEQAMSEADLWRRRCGFLMIDLDRFKAVNDTLGHQVGDRLLAQVAKRLGRQLSLNEVAGRLGGDEFAVVVKEIGSSEDLALLSNRIINELSKPYEVDQHTLYIGASIGSAVAPRDGRTVETLMRNADLALYRSKQEGGGKHHEYENRLHAHAEERRLMEFALRQALERNEFQLHFQPVVDVATEELRGFESLLRWTNPEYGSVSPARFIPIAEDARLIVPIGEWVLRQACLEAMKWPEPICVAVNVSAEQLNDPEFMPKVVEILRTTGLPAQRLEIEITESIFLRDGGSANATLDQIRALGCRLSLDDFGTGYSSLGYLRKTHFNTIKIDRSFVQGAASGVPECVAICRAVVAMADSLGMRTTAEGVETEEQLQAVRQLGCTKIQGYYYGRPMPAEDALAIFRTGSSQAVGWG